MSSSVDRSAPSEHPEELTTQQAADLRHVSRSYLISLLEYGAIPYREIGNPRHLQLEDVVTYKIRIDQEREAVLDELAREAQEQGHGY